MALCLASPNQFYSTGHFLSYYNFNMFFCFVFSKVFFISFFSFFNRLRIKRAMQTDSGNYTCVPTVAKPTSVYVHIISGKLFMLKKKHNKQKTSHFI
jgi:hypothetical protein